MLYVVDPTKFTVESYHLGMKEHDSIGNNTSGEIVNKLQIIIMLQLICSRQGELEQKRIAVMHLVKFEVNQNSGYVVAYTLRYNR